MTQLALRPYQVDAIKALETGFAKGDQRLGVAAPTGVGKTVILATLAHRWSLNRVLILVHRDELAEQTVDKLRSVDPKLSVGVVKARRNEGGASVVVASVQTVGRRATDGTLRRLAQIGRFGLIICDEAHRSMSAQWQDVLTELGALTDGGPRCAGFSATWVRSDRIGLGDFWQRIAYRLSTGWAIRKGYLVPPIGKAVRVDLDLSGIRKVGGDYSDKALGLALTDRTIAAAIVHAYREYAADRPGVLFAPTVDSARYFAAALAEAGFPTECVFGTTPIEERRGIYRRSRNGTTQIMASCGVLAEGFDAPWLSCGVLARPTLHPGLFVQQVGRVLRPSPETGKVDAIILDIVGATELHKLDWWQELANTQPSDPKTDPDDDEDTDEDFGGFDLADKRRDARIIGFEDVTLFGAQDAKWHRTVHGVMFVDMDSQLVFVEPQPEDTTHWRIGVCSKHSISQGRWVAEWISEQATAMDQAGEYAMEHSPTTASRTASWRYKARHRAPNARQATYARSLGIKEPEKLNAEQVSDAITYVIGSRTLAMVRYPATVGG